MRRAFAALGSLTMGLLMCAPSALAGTDDAEGRACQTTSECGDELHCIEGTCVAVVGGEVRPFASKPHISTGTAAMFGNGQEYGLTMLGVDIAAVAATGLLVGIATATQTPAVGVAALFPAPLTGPIVHLAYGRPLPALISFWGWTSVEATSLLFGVVAALVNGLSGNDNGTLVALATGGGVAIAGAIGMTALDMYFARHVTLRREELAPTVSLFPAIVPLRWGAQAGLVGTF